VLETATYGLYRYVCAYEIPSYARDSSIYWLMACTSYVGSIDEHYDRTMATCSSCNRT